MKVIRIFTVDAFTTQKFYGNPAGVVPFADELTEEEMQNIAKEINLSETAFILSADEINHVRVRYFTPTKEINFCGHATIALAWVLGTIYNYTSKGTLQLETKVGLIPIEWVMEDRRLVSVIMTQVEPKQKPIATEIDEITKLLGVSKEDIDFRYPISLGYTGNWHLLVPLKSRIAIDEAKPDFVNLGIHNKALGVATTHLYTFTNDDNYLYTRDFAPSAGINEDPVTGSANGALAGFLVLNGYIPKEGEFKVIQTNSLNRNGTLLIKTSVVNDKIQIQVGGSAVIVIDGALQL